MFRAAELALPKGFALKVVRFPGGKDPDELLRNSGPEAIQEAVEKARDFFEFALSYLNGENGTEPAGKAATAEQRQARAKTRKSNSTTSWRGATPSSRPKARRSATAP